jgi:hypothetical protein
MLRRVVDSDKSPDAVYANRNLTVVAGLSRGLPPAVLEHLRDSVF